MIIRVTHESTRILGLYILTIMQKHSWHDVLAYTSSGDTIRGNIWLVPMELLPCRSGGSTIEMFGDVGEELVVAFEYEGIPLVDFKWHFALLWSVIE